MQCPVVACGAGELGLTHAGVAEKRRPGRAQQDAPTQMAAGKGYSSQVSAIGMQVPVPRCSGGRGLGTCTGPQRPNGLACTAVRLRMEESGLMRSGAAEKQRAGASEAGRRWLPPGVAARKL